MRMVAMILALGCGTAVVAQEAHSPVIPNLIAPGKGDTRVSVIVDRGVTSHKQLRTAASRRARAALHAGQEVSAADLRALAGAGDGLAAQRYVRILQAAKTPADPSDIAFYAAVAVGTGRVWTLGAMIEAMHKLDPATEPKARVRKYIQVLYPHAWAGNTAALEAVVAFNGEGRLFGPLSERTRQRIAVETRAHGDGRIELGMAMGLLERARAAQTLDPADLDQARDLLVRAAASEHLAVATTAQNLLRLMDARAG